MRREARGLRQQLLLLLAALRGAASQPSLSCGSAPCFSQVFGSNGVLQRGPGRAAFFGSAGDGTAPGAAIAVRLEGTLADGSSYNKTMESTVRADGTWKVLTDPMPTGGSFSAVIVCDACQPAPDANDPLLNLTFGDNFHCGGQSNMNLMTVHSFIRNETYWAMSQGAYDNLRTITFLGCGAANESGNFVCGRRQPASQGCAPNGDLANWCAPRYMVVNGTGDSGYGEQPPIRRGLIFARARLRVRAAGDDCLVARALVRHARDYRPPLSVGDRAAARRHGPRRGLPLHAEQVSLRADSRLRVAAERGHAQRVRYLHG